MIGLPVIFGSIILLIIACYAYRRGCLCFKKLRTSVQLSSALEKQDFSFADKTNLEKQPVTPQPVLFLKQ